MSLAEYEYEVHSSVDVFEDLGHVGERLKSMAESIQLVDKNELKKLSDRLFDAREIQRKSDRGAWIQARWVLTDPHDIIPAQSKMRRGPIRLAKSDLKTLNHLISE